ARRVLPWAGLAGIAVAAVSFGPATAFPGTAALLPVLGAAAIVAGGGNVLLEWRPVRALGDVSYSFYLWHWPVLVIAAGYAERDLAVGVDLLLLAAALALSAGTYVLVEKPFRAD